MIIGIDYSSFDAVLCAIPNAGGKPKLAKAVFRSRSNGGGESLSVPALGDVRERLVEALADLTGGSLASFEETEQMSVWLERGYGSSRRSDWILGAYFGAIWSSVWSVLRWGDALNPLDLREWKREVTGASGIGVTVKGVGNGNVKKEIANEATRAILQLVEVDGSTWTPDELDAYGVAWAARRIALRAAGEEAA